MASSREFERLEQALVRVGSEIAYPATPALAERLVGQSEPQAQSGNTRGPFLSARPARRRWMLAAAVVLALVLLFAFPPTRDALAQLLGLRTVRIFFVTSPTLTPTATITPTLTVTPTGTVAPRPTATATPQPSPTATPGSYTLCCETTLADARQRARFGILLPPGQTPSRVYFEDLTAFGSAQQVILLFGDPNAPRFRLYEAESMIYGKLLFMYGKDVGQGAVLAETMVNGYDARWISGAPHVLVYLDPNGLPDPRTEQTVDANTLVWETGPARNTITFRVETKLSEEEAIRFAESLR